MVFLPLPWSPLCGHSPVLLLLLKEENGWCSVFVAVKLSFPCNGGGRGPVVRGRA